METIYLPDEGRPTFESKQGETLTLAGYCLPDNLLVWLEKSATEATCKGISVYNVDEEVLKQIDIWNKLSPEVQAKVGKKDVEHKVEVANVPKKRGKRAKNPDHAGLPTKLKCIMCNQLKGTTPEQFLKQVAKSGKSQEDFALSYKCRRCRKEDKV